jgi:hypothetical protein
LSRGQAYGENNACRRGRGLAAKFVTGVPK